MNDQANVNHSKTLIPSSVLSEYNDGLSESTRRAYLSDIRLFYGVNSLDELTLEAVTSVTVGSANAYLNELYDSGMANATINRKMQALSNFYAFLCGRGIKIMDYNPFSKNEGAIRLKNYYIATKLLEIGEVQKFIHVLNELTGLAGLRDKIIIILMITTELKRAEIASLKIGQINRIHEKFVIVYANNGKKDKIVVISDQLKSLIDSYLKFRSLSYLNKDSSLFVSHSTNGSVDKAIVPETIYLIVKRVAKKAGIREEYVSPKSLRQSIVSIKSDFNYSDQEIHDLLGYNETATIINHFLKTVLNKHSIAETMTKKYNLFGDDQDYKQKIISNYLEGDPMKVIGDQQLILEKLFPRLKSYPMNSLTPSLGEKEGEPVVSMLILADDFMIDDFRINPDGDTPIEITTYTAKNLNGMGLDFIMRLDFYYPSGHPVFKTVISADELDRQTELLLALKKVKELYIWIANKDRKVERFMVVDFEYENCKDAIDAILNKKGFQ